MEKFHSFTPDANLRLDNFTMTNNVFDRRESRIFFFFAETILLIELQILLFKPEHGEVDSLCELYKFVFLLL